MTDGEFQTQLMALSDLPYGENFETALYQLYRVAEPERRSILRQMNKAGQLRCARPWKNPADYDRSDLTRERHMRESPLANSLEGIGSDWRDTIRSIADCYYNLLVVGADADAALEELIRISDPEFANVVSRFARQPHGRESMKGWGLGVVQTPRGPEVWIERA
jgi:hypothetical protein